MFESSLSEMLLVGLIALLAIGPEKLPAVARLAGFWLGKTRRTIATVKAEMRQELEIEALRSQLASSLAERRREDAGAALADIDAALEALAEPGSTREAQGLRPDRDAV